MNDKQSAIFDNTQVIPWSKDHLLLTEFDFNERRHVDHILDQEKHKDYKVDGFK